jgi:hypothetical protein
MSSRPLIDKSVLWRHALATSYATFDPDDPTVIHVRHRNNSPWFDLEVPPGAIRDTGATIGVMIEGRGWIEATPARPA